MPSLVGERGTDISVAARFSNRRDSGAEDPRFWMAHPMCRAAINRRVTGSPNEWPLEWFARLYGPRKTGLSLACGIGNLERSARRIGLCESIMGIDASSRSLNVARERAREEEIQGLTYLEADLNQLKLGRGAYDVAFIHHSLHHVGSLEKLFGSVARALKPEGVLFLDEWTGPAMTDWSPALLARPAALFAELPLAWRRWPEFQPPGSVNDSSEGARSSDILPTLNLFFDSLEVRPYGGHLAALLTAELDTAVDPGPDLDGFIANWLAMEEEDLRTCPARSYHHVVVAKPRRGVDAARGRLIAFAGRVGLALRYLVPRVSKRVREVFGSTVGRSDPLVPPIRLGCVGDGDFRAVGEEFLQLFRGLGGLEPAHRVLDVGCGTGRMALPLSRFLEPPGSYDGFDVSGPGIAWCREAISRRFPAFRFAHVDVSNSEYNPRGRIDPRDFVFPYADASFDFILATSLFTHLLPEACARYIGEMSRVLAPDGRCFITAFLLNERFRLGVKTGEAARGFENRRGEAFVDEPERPEAAVAYDEQVLVRLLAEAGLAIASLRHGYWTGRNGLTFQDVVVCRKDGAPQRVSRVDGPDESSLAGDELALSTFEEPLVCSHCRGPLAKRATRLVCARCNLEFPYADGIADFSGGVYYDEFHRPDVLTAANLRGLENEAEGARIEDYYAPILDGMTGKPNGARLRVLDSGCGNGASVDALQRRGFDAWGHDLSALRKWQWLRCERRDRLVVADGAGLPFPDGFFDVIIASGVLEHVGVREKLGPYRALPLPDRDERRRGYLAGLFRVLAPGGRVFLDFPNGAFPIDFWHGVVPGAARFHARREGFLPTVGEIRVLCGAIDERLVVSVCSPEGRLRFHQVSAHWYGRLLHGPMAAFYRLMSVSRFRFLAATPLNPFLVIEVRRPVDA